MKCVCFVMQMYVCVLGASCDSSQCCVLQDLQFGLGCKRRLNGRGSKRHSLHAVELSLRSGKPCAKLCRPLPLPAMWARLPFSWGGLPCGPAGWLAMLLIKAGDVETNPGPTTTHKQVWICDICHRQIQVGKQISM